MKFNKAHLLGVRQQIIATCEEEEGCCVFQWESIVRHLLAARNFISALFIGQVTFHITLGQIPYCVHQTVDKELVFRGRGLLSCIPHFAVAPFHKPSLNVHRMFDVWVFSGIFDGHMKRFQSGMKIGDAVLCQKANEVEAQQRVLSGRGREDGSTSPLEHSGTTRTAETHS